jgi:hypothetical protein
MWRDTAGRSLPLPCLATAHWGGCSAAASPAPRGQRNGSPHVDHPRRPPHPQPTTMGRSQVGRGGPVCCPPRSSSRPQATQPQRCASSSCPGRRACASAPLRIARLHVSHRSAGVTSGATWRLHVRARAMRRSHGCEAGCRRSWGCCMTQLYTAGVETYTRSTA